MEAAGASQRPPPSSGFRPAEYLLPRTSRTSTSAFRLLAPASSTSYVLAYPSPEGGPPWKSSKPSAPSSPSASSLTSPSRPTPLSASSRPPGSRPAPPTASPGTSSPSTSAIRCVSSAAIAQSGPYIAQAPFAVAVCIEDTDFAVSDASRAVQSMVLTAWAEGIGSNWAGFRNLEGARPILGIPENLEVLCIVPFGYPARPVGKGKKERKPFAQVVSRNSFGQRFE